MAIYSEMIENSETVESEVLVANDERRDRSTEGACCSTAIRGASLPEIVDRRLRKTKRRCPPPLRLTENLLPQFELLTARVTCAPSGNDSVRALTNFAKRRGVQGAKGPGQDRANQRKLQLTVVLSVSSRTHWSIAGERKNMSSVKLSPSIITPNLTKANQ